MSQPGPARPCLRALPSTGHASGAHDGSSPGTTQTSVRAHSSTSVGRKRSSTSWVHPTGMQPDTGESVYTPGGSGQWWRLVGGWRVRALPPRRLEVWRLHIMLCGARLPEASGSPTGVVTRQEKSSAVRPVLVRRNGNERAWGQGGRDGREDEGNHAGREGSDGQGCWGFKSVHARRASAAKQRSWWDLPTTWPALGT